MLGINADVVFVAPVALAAFWRPTSIRRFLCVLMGLVWPRWGQLSWLDLFVLVGAVMLLGEGYQRRLDDLSAWGGVAWLNQISIEWRQSGFDSPRRRQLWAKSLHRRLGALCRQPPAAKLPESQSVTDLGLQLLIANVVQLLQ